MSILEKIAQTSDGILESNQNVREMLGELRSAGYFAVLVDRATVFDKATLLHALYQSCVFPAYFGFNWDALEDTLLDFSWLDFSWLGVTQQEVKGYVLVFRNFAVLEERAENVAETFLEIVRDVVKVRREKKAASLLVVMVR
jgi:Barstar (barnase inhibitor)